MGGRNSLRKCVMLSNLTRDVRFISSLSAARVPAIDDCGPCEIKEEHGSCGMVEPKWRDAPGEQQGLS